MIFKILTLFPEMIENYMQCSIMKRATDSGHITCEVLNIRDFADDKHHTADDTPFGGGPGMVMKPEPVKRAIEAAQSSGLKPHPVVYLSPQGRQWTQEVATEFADLDGMVLLCGRYEGIDERIIENYVDHEISVGDYVLTGGELGALIMMDSISRLIPGVLGNNDSAFQDSFGDIGLLDCPHYTRPEVWNGMPVPEILLSGHHAKIADWRRQQSLIRTRNRRPDIFEKAQQKMTKKDLKLLKDAIDAFGKP